MPTYASRSPSKSPTPRKQTAVVPVPPPAQQVQPAEIQIPAEEVARRAYEKFAARGYEHGLHERDWLDAEDELRAEYRDRQ